MLRDYQLTALEQIRSNIRAGINRSLLCMPTGAGKTATFCEILKNLERNGRPGLMVVRGVRVLDQGSQRLAREGVPHGVIRGNDKRRDDSHLIQVASVDTLYRRRYAPPADVLVIDECHLALSDSFQWLIAQYPDAFIIAVTATPFHPQGFRSMADAIVQPVTTEELIERGYLVPSRIFVPSEPDLSTVAKSNGDFVQKDLGEMMNQARLFGPIVESWKSHGEGRPTLLFAVNISHATRLRDAFISAGIPAELVTGEDSHVLRDECAARLERGETKILCSVGTLTTGFDSPPVSCLIIARPTLSYPLHVQMLGRGSRPYPGKQNFIVLDHAGNTLRHGLWETHREPSLDGKQPIVNIGLSTCKKCFGVYESGQPTCPVIQLDGTVCGYRAPPPEKPRNPIAADESRGLEEILTPEQMEERMRLQWIIEKCHECDAKGYRKPWVYHQVKKRYGDDVAKKSWRIIHEVLR